MMRTNSQSGSRRRYYTRYLAHYTKKNHVILLLGGMFLLGVVFGTLLVRTAGGDLVELLLRLIGNASQRRREAGFTQNIVSGLSSGMALLACLFVGGFCAVARPVVVLAPMLRGMGFGFSAASLYLRYGPGAAGFVGAFMLPGMVITTIAMLFCCNEALHLSGNLWALLRQRDTQPYSLRIYCARFAAAAVLWFLAVLLEGALYALLPSAFLLA